MDCSKCRYNMKDRASEIPPLKGKVACLYHTVKIHGTTLNGFTYVNPQANCDHGKGIEPPVVIRRGRC